MTDHPSEQVDRVAQAIRRVKPDIGLTAPTYRRMACAALDAATPPLADKAADDLKWIHKGLGDAYSWRDWDEVGRLRGRVKHVMALLRAGSVGERDQP